MVFALRLADLQAIGGLIALFAAFAATISITRSKRFEAMLTIFRQGNDELRETVAFERDERQRDKAAFDQQLHDENLARNMENLNCLQQLAELEGKLKFAIEGNMAMVIADAVSHAIKSNTRPTEMEHDA